MRNRTWGPCRRRRRLALGLHLRVFEEESTLETHVDFGEDGS
jgi:hypothetical protein